MTRIIYLIDNMLDQTYTNDIDVYMYIGSTLYKIDWLKLVLDNLITWNVHQDKINIFCWTQNLLLPSSSSTE